MNLQHIKNIYFVGIGGIGMSSLAKYFAKNGKNVAGYDKTPTKITKSLEQLNVAIHFNDSIAEIPVPFLDKTTTAVVYTPAIPESHSELQYFTNQGFSILKRAEILGKITAETKCLAVAGTHGKTTTSSILGHIMTHENATTFLGGIAENYNSNLILGDDKIAVVEADEFDRSFLKLKPNIACITSVDADHLDIYNNVNALEESFYEFSQLVSGTLIVAKGIPIQGVTYAVEEDADYVAFNIRIENGTYVFDVKTPLTTVLNINFSLPGKHNLMNALAAIAMADVYGIPLDIIKSKITTYRGVQRRFSYKIKTDNIVLVDDYAHHPTEITAVQNALRELYPKDKILVIFQPHLFSRTRDFMDDFANSLSLFDEIALLDIYPAREEPIPGVNTKELLKRVSNTDKKHIHKQEVIKTITQSNAKVVAMLGAGDIGVVIEQVTKLLLKDEKYAI